MDDAQASAPPSPHSTPPSRQQGRAPAR